MYICNLACFLHASLGCPVTRAAPFGVPNVLRRVAARIAAEIAARITAESQPRFFLQVFNFGSKIRLDFQFRIKFWSSSEKC